MKILNKIYYLKKSPPIFWIWPSNGANPQWTNLPSEFFPNCPAIVVPPFGQIQSQHFQFSMILMSANLEEMFDQKVLALVLPFFVQIGWKFVGDEGRKDQGWQFEWKNWHFEGKWGKMEAIQGIEYLKVENEHGWH